MKIGIEIHQRLDTGKLFCGCESSIDENEKPAAVIRRKLHPVPSETGEIDEASKVEFMKNRTYEYQVFARNNCLVEMDEEPPHEMNRDALDAALGIALRLNACVVDEMQVMRKIVIDGSNTTGFQRTAQFGFDGNVETSRGPVRIETISIEEESAGIISKDEERAVYRLDRLGIPLIEITTAPDIMDGDHLRETAEKIGMMLRATGKVARGLGTIRQDVNVSVEGGARVEIKGAQDLKMLKTLVETEAERQGKLILITAELKKRGFSGSEGAVKDITQVFQSTKAELIRKGLDRKLRVFGMRLEKHAGLLGMEIQPGKRYGTEMSNYAKQAGVKGMIHSDESMEKYGISGDEASAVRKALGCAEGDAFVLVIEREDVCRPALSYVKQRAEMLFVPGETRKAEQDGTTTYMRPIPGRARMYPETDIAPIRITKALLREVEGNMGESLDEKRAGLEKMLNKEMAEKMLKSQNLGLFERFVAEGNDPKVVSATLENTLIALRRDGFVLKDAQAGLTEVFALYKEGKITKNAIPEIIRGMCGGKSAVSVVKELKLERMHGAELEKIKKENGNDMRAIMEKYRLRIEASDLQHGQAKK
ncbi:MAG: Glu-tRNA(Gln) amidotransferase subunit GatE [Candidatus Bilamarchaeaceae archaeon]